MKTHLKIAQITDSHLFSDKTQLHCGANVYNNLYNVLKRIKYIDKPDCIVFTGDLTQDHTEGSYKQFADVFSLLEINIPVYYLAGNHDEYRLLNTALNDIPFTDAKLIENNHWQVILMDTKSEVPAGIITEERLRELAHHIDTTKRQLVMMHHHPINVGYFIDKHGLKNKEVLWEYVQKTPSIKALACGHVHQDLSIMPLESGHSIPLYTCPATSIQFDVGAETSACNGQGAGYRIFDLFDDETYSTETHFIKDTLETNDIG
jgi:Icc protein